VSHSYFDVQTNEDNLKVDEHKKERLARMKGIYNQSVAQTKEWPPKGASGTSSSKDADTKGSSDSSNDAEIPIGLGHSVSKGSSEDGSSSKGGSKGSSGGSSKDDGKNPEK